MGVEPTTFQWVHTISTNTPPCHHRLAFEMSNAAKDTFAVFIYLKRRLTLGAERLSAVHGHVKTKQKRVCATRTEMKAEDQRFSFT